MKDVFPRIKSRYVADQSLSLYIRVVCAKCAKRLTNGGFEVGTSKLPVLMVCPACGSMSNVVKYSAKEMVDVPNGQG